MQCAVVALYVNVARDGETPAWLRVGRGWLLPDGTVRAVLDHLPADGRIRVQLEQAIGADGAQGCAPPSPRGASAPEVAACRPPPLPAARRRRLPQEVKPW
ncbi:MAG: hypothetical protein JXB32_07995 [Deltaproteobacteria bacterium]|nr:hypothetical protein [Deltaproteobacteria bacterium]